MVLGDDRKEKGRRRMAYLIKPNFIRFCQFDQSKYKKYRIKKIKPTVELVIGFKK